MTIRTRWACVNAQAALQQRALLEEYYYETHDEKVPASIEADMLRTALEACEKGQPVALTVLRALTGAIQDQNAGLLEGAALLYISANDK